MRAFPLRRARTLAASAVLVVLVGSCGGGDGGGPPEPASVIVTPGTDTLFAINATQAFTAQVLDDDGDPITGAAVTWSSSDTTIVQVNGSGLATAKKNGAVNIIATIEGLEGEAPVTVAQVPTTVTISPSTANFTFVGDTQTFTTTVLDAGGSPVLPVQKIWTLNDNTVAVIDSAGLARAKGPGIAMVTVVAIGPGGARAGYAAVTTTQPVASIHLRHQPTFAIAGEAIDPAIQVDVRDSGGAVVVGYEEAITIGIDSGPVGAIMRGTRMVHAVNGVATFSGLSFDRTGQHLLTATATDLAPAMLAPFPVHPNFPDHVKLIATPLETGGVTAGEPIFIRAVVADRLGNARPDSQVGMTLIVAEALPGGELHGSNAGAWNNAGFYEFPSAYLTKAQTSYVLEVWSSGITTARTEDFAVLPGAPARITLTADSGIRVGTAIGAPLTTVKILDLFGNPTIADTTQVSFSTWWMFPAPIGKGQMVLPADTVVVIGQKMVGPLRYTRPGPTMLIASGAGLISDSGAVYNANFWQATGAYIGGAHVCIDVRYCAGANDHGELGVDPSLLTEDSIFVFPDSATNDFGPIVFGATSACAVDFILPGATPTVMCRGANDKGQLGRGATGADDPQWQRIAGATGWWTVAMGDAHACALAADSTAVCWGRNDHGQLGRGTMTAFEATPAAVLGGAKFSAIAAGGDHSCGITTTSGMLCWGENGSGQLGDSTVADTAAPVVVGGGHTWVLLALGSDFTCGVKTNSGRKVLCWGANDVGQLGDPSAGAGRSYPDLVAGGLNDLPFRLAAGRAHACAQADASIICWGDDSRGQIGNGPGSSPILSPVGKTLPGSPPVVGLAAGGDQTCALGYIASKFKQVLYCWGANDRGQLGIGTTTDEQTTGEPWQ